MVLRILTLLEKIIIQLYTAYVDELYKLVGFSSNFCKIFFFFFAKQRQNPLENSLLLLNLENYPTLIFIP